MEIAIRVIAAIIASVAFAIIFNVRGKNIFLAGLTGGLGYLVYLLVFPYSGFGAAFFSSMTISLCAEIMARIYKKPATLFLVAGLIPIVPGGGMYKMMLLAFRNDVSAAATTAYSTLMIAGSIAMGIIAVTSLSRTLFARKVKIG